MRTTKMLLLSLGFCWLLSAASGNEGPDAENQDKSPVYFPILPEDFKDFGVKLSDLGAFPSPPTPLRTGKVNMPVTTAKPITTTDKLPINPEGILSHVALEAVTEPPGPSYLTDSYYYLDDHTPAPGSGEDSAEGHGHGDITSLLDRESESFGDQTLQDLSPVREENFGERTPTALALQAPEPSQAAKRPPIRVTSRHTTPAPLPTRRPTTVPTTTSSPIPPTTPASRSNKNMKLRPAFTPIPTPAPTRSSAVNVPVRSHVVQPSTRPPTSRTPTHISRPSTRIPSSNKRPERVSSVRPTSRPERVSSRRSKFESSRVSKPQGPRLPTRRPTVAQKTSYRSPTPPTVSPAPSTTIPTPSRTYGERAPAASAPRRQYLSAVTNSPGESPVYRTSTKSYRAPSSLFHVRGATTTVTAPPQPDFVQSDQNIYVPVEYDEEAIPGEAGVDYPNYRTVPDTSFTCDAQEHPGLYADRNTRCQAFHICQEDGRQDSFLCPNGTVFNQQYFVCDWWYNFSCDHADRFYSLNAFIYELPESAKYEK